jgi:hypothetical protein
MTSLTAIPRPHPRYGNQSKRDWAFVILHIALFGYLVSSHFTGDQLRQDLRRWLSAPDPWTNHNVARKSHYRGTATWFTQGQTFAEWKSTGSLLWIHGMRAYLQLLSLLLPLIISNILAGSGKSILWYVLL